jgi:hypothetical protein
MSAISIGTNRTHRFGVLSEMSYLNHDRVSTVGMIEVTVVEAGGPGFSIWFSGCLTLGLCAWGFFPVGCFAKFLAIVQNPSKIASSPRPSNGSNHQSPNDFPSVLAAPNLTSMLQYGMILRRQYNPVPEEVSSIEPLASNLRNSTRNTPGNRNRLNSPSINDLNFSTRNKTRGVSGQIQSESSKINRRAWPLWRPKECGPSSTSFASGPQNLIATPANRNHPN